MSVTTPVVSVIIPAFNAAAFISKALDSVLEQSIRDIEVIVVDDASTDSTVDVVRAYVAKDGRVRLLSNAHNSGPAYSRNQAIKAASGVWLAILDADDWYAPDRLEQLLQVAEVSHADFIADDLWRIEKDQTIPYGRLFPAGYPQKPWAILTVDEYLLRNPVGENNTFGLLKPLLKRDYLLSRGFSYDETLRLGEDFFLYLEMLAAGATAVIVPEAYYYYLSRVDSLTQVRSKEDIARMLQGLERVLRSPHVLHNSALLACLQVRRKYVAHYQLPVVGIIEALKRKEITTSLMLLFTNPHVFIMLSKRLFRRLRARV